MGDTLFSSKIPSVRRLFLSGNRQRNSVISPEPAWAGFKDNATTIPIKPAMVPRLRAVPGMNTPTPVAVHNSANQIADEAIEPANK